jgi:hypothetical protein
MKQGGWLIKDLPYGCEGEDSTLLQKLGAIY